MDCLHCRKLSATPNPPFMADVPKGRLKHNHEHFTNTGTDYFGLFYIIYQRPRDQMLQRGRDAWSSSNV